ncbi:type II toxin-antitoxin system HipA family toxin [Amorphus sp. 3PC139-8]|uniref:type II toxin-antitoxin system HipA family toxin n=1 Tax=Amorphus sp. 3PC139-8 TaxID=2735676 RepID=UPI00345D4B69
MSTRTLSICIGDNGLPVGTLRFDAQGNREFSQFEYADSWLRHSRRFAIAPSMPLSGGPFFFKKQGGGSPLPPPIADTTPDTWGRNIIRRDTRERRANRAPLTELDYLLAVDDHSRMGALRIREPETDAPFLASAAGGRHDVPPLLHLDELGQAIAQIEQESPGMAAALRRLRQIGSSLGGARPKCSVVDTDGSLLIAKFTSRHDTYSVEQAEVLTLTLAARCSIKVPRARLAVSDGLPVALIPRFDRRPNGRVPYISAQTMLETADADSGTYTQLADAIRMHSAKPSADLTELFKRVAFTILVSNVDDHLKNHGFLYAGDNLWRLSPMFDVNPAPERHRELKTHISEISGSDASCDVLIEHAPFFDLTEDEGAAIVHATATEVSQSWRPIAESLGMTRADIAAYQPAFDHPEMQKARAMTPRSSDHDRIDEPDAPMGP